MKMQAKFSFIIYIGILSSTLTCAADIDFVRTNLLAVYDTIQKMLNYSTGYFKTLSKESMPV